MKISTFTQETLQNPQPLLISRLKCKAGRLLLLLHGRNALLQSYQFGWFKLRKKEIVTTAIVTLDRFQLDWPCCPVAAVSNAVRRGMLLDGGFVNNVVLSFTPLSPSPHPLQSNLTTYNIVHSIQRYMLLPFLSIFDFDLFTTVLAFMNPIG